MSAVLSPPATTLRVGTPEDVGMSTPAVERIAERAEEWVRDGVAPGMVLLAARRGRIVFHRAFGRRSPSVDAPPMPLDALFELSSTGKVLTATAIMVLVEEGRVGLNRPVSSYIPEFHGEGKERVLVRHLLTHTSGLQDVEVEKYAKEVQGKVPIPRAEETIHPLLHEWLTERYGCPLWKPPDEEMSYSPFGFEVLGEIIRRVSRTSLDRFLRERVFGPIGMNDTFSCPAGAPPGRPAERPPNPSVVPDAVDIARETEPLALGSGGELSTANDLAVFGQMFLNGGAYGTARELSPTTVAAMTRNQIPGIRSTFGGQVFPEASWGLGWSVHGAKTGLCGGLYSPDAYEHWGAGGSYLWVDPRYEIVGVYLSSAPYGSTADLWTKHWRNDLFTDLVTAAVTDP